MSTALVPAMLGGLFAQRAFQAAAVNLDAEPRFDGGKALRPRHLPKSPLLTRTRLLGHPAAIAKTIVDVFKQIALEGVRRDLDAMVPLVLGAEGHATDQGTYFARQHPKRGKILSLFEPSTEVIRKGKSGKPNEFGKMINIQETENQIITDYEVYDRRPNDADLPIAAIETHAAKLGRMPRLVAADAAFYSAKNEAGAKARGVKRICIPNRSTKSPERRREQKSAGSATARNGEPDAKAGSAS